MSKFCGNCGSQCDDSDAVCGYCGTPFAGEPAVTGAGKGITGSLVKNDTKKGKFIKYAGIAVCGLLIIAVLAGILSSAGYKGTVKKMMRAFEKQDSQKLVSLISETYMDATNKNADNLKRVYGIKVEDTLEKYIGKCGKIKSISYNITNVTKLKNEDNFDSISEVLEKLGYKDKEIKTLRRVEMTVTFKGKENKTTVSYNNLILIKESGKWRIIPGYNF